MNHFSKKHLEKVLFSLDVQIRTTLDAKTHRTSITRRTVQLTSLRLCSGHVTASHCLLLHAALSPRLHPTHHICCMDPAGCLQLLFCHVGLWCLQCDTPANACRFPDMMTVVWLFPISMCTHAVVCFYAVGTGRWVRHLGRCIGQCSNNRSQWLACSGW